MDRDTFAKIVAGEHEADLSEEESKAFEELLANDPECRELLAAAEDELAPLAAWEPEAPTEAQWARVTAAVKDSLAVPTPAVASEDDESTPVPRSAPSLAAPAGDSGVIINFPSVEEGRGNLPALLALAAGFLVLLGVAFVMNTSGPGHAGDTSAHLKVAKTKSPPAKKTTEAPVPPLPPSESDRPEALELSAGEGFEVEAEMIDDDLLCVVVREVH